MQKLFGGPFRRHTIGWNYGVMLSKEFSKPNDRGCSLFCDGRKFFWTSDFILSPTRSAFCARTVLYGDVRTSSHGCKIGEYNTSCKNFESSYHTMYGIQIVT
jgi:hypothetical protein